MAKSRELNIGTKKFTKVVAIDEPRHDVASRKYFILRAKESEIDAGNRDYYTNKFYTSRFFGEILFQDGPIKEADINGCHNEDLLAIVIDRLKGFQSGQLPCRENAIALTKIEEAMHWLNHRTKDRLQRGVVGTKEK